MPLSQRWRLAFFAVCFGVGCAGGDPDPGRAVAITLSFDASVGEAELASVRTLSFEETGDEAYTGSLSLDRPAAREERLLFVPSKSARTIQLAVVALDEAGRVLARGQSAAITLPDSEVRTDVSIALTVEVDVSDGATDGDLLEDLSTGDASDGGIVDGSMPDAATCAMGCVTDFNGGSAGPWVLDATTTVSGGTLHINSVPASYMWTGARLNVPAGVNLFSASVSTPSGPSATLRIYSRNIMPLDPCSVFMYMTPAGAINYSYHDVDGTGHFANVLTTVTAGTTHTIEIDRTANSFTFKVDGAAVGGTLVNCTPTDWSGLSYLGTIANSATAMAAAVQFDNVTWRTP